MVDEVWVDGCGVVVGGCGAVVDGCEVVMKGSKCQNVLLLVEPTILEKDMLKR